MKYIPPQNGQYESALTPQFLYDSVNSLITTHCSGEEIEQVRKGFGTTDKKLWHKEPIRNELTELVESYFFTDLKDYTPTLKEAIFADREESEKKLKTYVSQLKEKYGSEVSAHMALHNMLKEVKRRQDFFFQQNIKLNELREVLGIDFIMLQSATDSLSHISAPYVGVDLLI